MARKMERSVTTEDGKNTEEINDDGRWQEEWRDQGRRELKRGQQRDVSHQSPITD
jgi:hypothetical protein